MVNFMRDPTGDIPWEEDPTAGDVVHVDNKQVSHHSEENAQNRLMYRLKES